MIWRERRFTNVLSPSMKVGIMNGQLVFLIIGLYILFIGFTSFVRKEVTTFVGITGKKTVFTKFAAQLWGLGLLIGATGIFLWLIKPELFSHPFFSMTNFVISYVLLCILCAITELIQRKFDSVVDT